MISLPGFGCAPIWQAVYGSCKLQQWRHRGYQALQAFPHNHPRPCSVHVHAGRTCAPGAGPTPQQEAAGTVKPTEDDFEGFKPGCRFSSSCVRPTACIFYKLACKEQRQHGAVARLRKAGQQRMHCH